MRGKLVIITIFVIVFSVFTSSVATTMNATDLVRYSTVLYGTDTDGKYYFRQDSVNWDGYSPGVWPAGRYIAYAPYTQSYAQAGMYVNTSSVGCVSEKPNYYTGCSGKNNYRVGVFTSQGSLDTTFSFFV